VARPKAQRWNVEVQPRHPDVEAYFDAVEGAMGDLARRLRAIIHEEVPDVLEGMKWAVPFFFGKGPLCYISPAQRHVTFGLARGMEIDDPSGVLTGTGRSPIRKATLRPGHDEALVRDWLGQAVALDPSWEG
jgi:hypothetical protein